MRTFTALVLTLLLGTTASLGAESAAAPAAASAPRLFHVVSVKFKPAATPEQIAAVESAFRELKNKIPGIASLSWGTNVSPEKRNKGYTHCFVLTFAGDKDRDAYLVHPEHKAFGSVLGPVLEDVFVLDFVEKN